MFRIMVNGQLYAAHACPADHPVCRRPARQGAGRAKPVKMQRPAGRTILTGFAWSAGLVP
jgi:hypothetical protein